MNAELIENIKKGDVEKVKELIPKGWEQEEDDTSTPLKVAADCLCHGDWDHQEVTDRSVYHEICKLLIENGPKYKIDLSYTLWSFCQHGPLDLCELLLDPKIGADVNAINEMDESRALHYAAGAGQLDICKLLIRKGADVDAENDGGEKAVYNAKLHEHDEIVALLSDPDAIKELQNSTDE